MIAEISRFLGYLLLFFSNIIAVGLFAYQWALNGVALKVAVWQTSLVWVACMSLAWVLLIIYYTFGEDY